GGRYKKPTVEYRTKNKKTTQRAVEWGGVNRINKQTQTNNKSKAKSCKNLLLLTYYFLLSKKS
ncbi:MAG: hypothetical protein IJP35_06665, partial [Clostridia bacterium]|nr:hypothetical protein [Clostridia bacterium]